METILAVITTILSIAIILGIYFLKDLPTLFRELKVEQTKAQNNMELQREAYFREIGGKELYNTFNEWLGFLVDSDNKLKNFRKKQATELISKTIKYGSTKTINICGNYMKHVFEKVEATNNIENIENQSGELSYNTYKMILYVAFIVSSLKFDFTGYEVDPIKLLEIQISDFSKVKEKNNFKKAYKDIKAELGNKE